MNSIANEVRYDLETGRTRIVYPEFEQTDIPLAHLPNPDRQRHTEFYDAALTNDVRKIFLGPWAYNVERSMIRRPRKWGSRTSIVFYLKAAAPRGAWLAYGLDFDLEFDINFPVPKGITAAIIANTADWPTLWRNPVGPGNNMIFTVTAEQMAEVRRVTRASKWLRPETRTGPVSHGDLVMAWGEAYRQAGLKAPRVVYGRGNPSPFSSIHTTAKGSVLGSVLGKMPWMQPADNRWPGVGFLSDYPVSDEVGSDISAIIEQAIQAQPWMRQMDRTWSMEAIDPRGMMTYRAGAYEAIVHEVMEEVFGFRRTPAQILYDKMMQMCAGCWLRDDKVTIAPLPEKVTINERRQLHNTTGPAVTWPSDLAEEGWPPLYRVDNTPVPAEYFARPVTVNDIESVRNVETRRALMTMMGGPAAYIYARGLEPMDSHPEWGTLYGYDETSEGIVPGTMVSTAFNNMREAINDKIEDRILNGTGEDDASEFDGIDRSNIMNSELVTAHVGPATAADLAIGADPADDEPDVTVIDAKVVVSANETAAQMLLNVPWRSASLPFAVRWLRLENITPDENGVRREYWESMPPTVNTAAEAFAWRMNMTVEELQLIERRA